jgi:hypothetical protein
MTSQEEATLKVRSRPGTTREVACDPNLRPDKPFPPAQANGRGLGYGLRSGDRAGSRYDTLTSLFCYIFWVAPLGGYSDTLPCAMPTALRGQAGEVLPSCFVHVHLKRGHGTRLVRHLDTLTTLLCDIFCAAPLRLVHGVVGGVPDGTSCRGFGWESSRLPLAFTPGIGFQAFVDTVSASTLRPEAQSWVAEGCHRERSFRSPYWGKLPAREGIGCWCIRPSPGVLVEPIPHDAWPISTPAPNPGDPKDAQTRC